MRNGVNGSRILGLHHSSENPTECEKMTKKVIVKKPESLVWVMNLFLPLSPLTMPSYIIPPQYSPLLKSQKYTHLYRQKKKINQTQYSSDDKVNA
jgi:hypothetical protein